MARTEDEIQDIIKYTKEHFEVEFGKPLKYDYVEAAINKILSEKLESFIFKRIGHLPGVDLFKLMNSLMEDGKKKSRS